MKQVALDWVTVKSNVRSQPERADIEELMASMKRHGLWQPLVVKPDGELVAGHRRLLAAKLLGWDKIWVIISDRPLTDSEVQLIKLTENIQRKALEDDDVCEALEASLRLNPGWTHGDLAAALGKPACWLTRHLSPSKCSPAVKQAFKAGKINLSQVYSISKVPLGEQDELLAMFLQGCSREQVERQRKNKPSNQGSNGEGTKVKRIKLLLAPGITVVLSAKELSLQSAIKAAEDAHLLLKRGEKDGYTAKTIQKMSADLANGKPAKAAEAAKQG